MNTGTVYKFPTSHTLINKGHAQDWGRLLCYWPTFSFSLLIFPAVRPWQGSHRGTAHSFRKHLTFPSRISKHGMSSAKPVEIKREEGKYRFSKNQSFIQNFSWSIKINKEKEPACSSFTHMKFPQAIAVTNAYKYEFNFIHQH